MQLSHRWRFFSLLRSHGLFLGGGFKYKNPIWGRFPFFQEISNRIHWTDPSTWVSNSFSNLLRGPLVRSHSIFDGILTDIFRLGWNHHLGAIRVLESIGRWMMMVGYWVFRYMSEILMFRWAIWKNTWCWWYISGLLPSYVGIIISHVRVPMNQSVSRFFRGSDRFKTSEVASLLYCCELTGS